MTSEDRKKKAAALVLAAAEKLGEARGVLDEAAGNESSTLRALTLEHEAGALFGYWQFLYALSPMLARFARGLKP